MHGLEALLVAWGLPLLTAAAFLEGDAAAMVGGALAHRGTFGFVEAVVAAALGAFLSDQFWFRVGRAAARGPRMQRFLARPGAAKVQALLLQRPSFAILGVRFVWGIRIVGPAIIGAAGVNALTFLLVDIPAVILWALLMVGIGFGLGAVMVRLWGELHIGDHLVLAAVGAAGLSFAIWLLHRHFIRARS
jgi:membrane protein DedA with SNARE-associated domain